ncbi:MAG: WYL domain-containing protein [Bacteroidaceae bacterium]|nr:WYL domain-containing protein [Bacteroidaceae bacterium]
MANTKNATVREIILDRCLSDWNEKYTILNLMSACNRRLEEEKMELITSPTTIRLDLNNMETHYGVQIESWKVGRNVYYRYARKGMSIFHMQLKENELQLLNQTMQLFSRFEGLPHFEWLEELNSRLSSQFMMNPANKKAVVAFDENPYVEGMKHYRTLYQSIVKRQVLQIHYQSFKHKTPFVYTIHPYFLKQYNNRWFLLGWYEEWKEITTLPLDRIVQIKKVDNKYKDNEEYDFNEYFKNVIGVSFPKGNELMEIHLWIDKQQWPYIKTKPLHKSQKLVTEYEDGAAEISINVIPNFELESKILGQGMHMKVLSPALFKEKIQTQINLALKNYLQ